MPRDTEYGSPFRNVGSGVDEDKDSQNQTRFAQGLKNFSAQLKKSGDLAKYDTSMFETVQAKYGIYYGPLAGLIFGKFYCDAFTSPKSKYAPKLITLLFVLGGLRYGVNQTGRAHFLFETKNFPLFPKNVQEALMSGDSRYLREYLKDAKI